MSYISKIIKWISLLFIFYINIYLFGNYPPRIRFRHIAAKEGLSYRYVPSIIRDSVGFMWFGTQDGLNRYDGRNIKVYKHDPSDSTSISYNFIMDILEDSRGNLWIGTFGGGLNLYNREMDNFIRINPVKENENSTAFKYIRDILEDHSGNLWIAYDFDGIVKFNPTTNESKHFKNFPITDSLSTTIFRTICEDNNFNIWIGTYGKGVYKYDPRSERFKHYLNNPKNPNSLSSNKIWKIYKDRNGNIWICTHGGGLNLYNPENDNFIRFQYNPDNPNGIPSDYVISILQDSYGNLWIGTENASLCLFDTKNNTFYRYIPSSNDPNSISGWSIHNIYEDNLGTIWIATYDGAISYFNIKLEKFQHYYATGQENEINGNSVSCFEEAPDGKIWIGMDGMGINLWDRKNNIFYDFESEIAKKSLSYGGVLSLLVDDKNRLWIGTYLHGVNLWDPSTGKLAYFLPDENPGSISGADIRCIYQDSNGNIWLAANGGGLNLYRESDSTFIHFRNRPGDPNSIATDYIQTIYEDKKGNLWIGTYGYGLELFDRINNRFIHHIYVDSISTSISNNFVNCIYEDSKGRLWVGTDEGLNLFNRKEGTFKRITNKDGLPNDVINGILEDSNGNLWISTNNGISKFNYDDFTFINYNIKDGLQDNFFRPGSYFKLSTGEMLFGGDNGFNIFHPDSIKTNTFIPPVALTSLKIFNKEVEPGKNSPINKAITVTKEINLTYKDYLFSLTIASLNQWIPEKNQYAYRFVGENTGWINLGHNNTITFTSLSPGSYTLQFKASNNDGLWNQTGLQIKLKIAPPFWKTPLFLSIAGILSSFLIFMLIRMRLKTIEKRNKILNELNEKLKLEIEERKLIEAKLRKSEEKYREVVENAPFGIVIHKDGKIIFANSTLLKISGAKNYEQVIGKEALSFVSQEYKDIAKKRIENGYKKQKPAELTEEKLLKVDGTEFYAEVSAVPVKSQEGSVETHVFVIDITKRKKAEEEKEFLEEQLRQAQKLEAIGQLAGGIAHDFNNILTVIIGYTEILLGKELIKSDPHSHKFLKTILESADRAKNLVNQLLAFSRKQLFKPEKINFNTIISDMKNMLRRLISEDIELTFSFDKDLPDINADPQQIEQIIFNLITNARDAILEKGKSDEKLITIETGVSSLDSTYKTIDPEVKEGKYVYLAVTDTGIGMTQEVKKKIFEPFFTTKEVDKGTGLGLSTVYGIVKQNEGTVTVYSEPEKGSTFKIYWPIPQEDTQNQNYIALKSIDTEVPKGTETILFVEDEKEIRDMVKQTLQSIGYKVIIAANGHEALNLLRQSDSKIDLLITDVVMPEMTGKELADIITKNYPDIRVLFTSGYTDDYIVKEGMVDKNINFINKPFSVKDLAIMIRKILDKK